ncbi:MAG: AIR synthase-related protein, partial [Candidatus Poseidoniales archaeon]
NKEMHRTFNMGLGMVLAVSPNYAQEVLNWLNNRLSGCKIIGIVNDNGHRVTHIDPKVIFEHY